MKIIFKNVGQGDSIILEWLTVGGSEIGVIDCNIYENNNAVVEHLQNLKPQRIKFIILTHPHEDHFSGMLELLDYCDFNKITVERFILTGDVDQKWIEDAVNGSIPKLQLGKILAKILELNDKKLITYISKVSEGDELSLNDDISMIFYSPSYKQIVEFSKGKFKKSTGASRNNPDANNLSTIIGLQLRNSKPKILLVSDAPKASFQRIIELKKHIDFDIIVGQIPHHGSAFNFHEFFWKSIYNKNSVCISVGSGYNHPDDFVIQRLKTTGYQIYSTNFVGALPNHFITTSSSPSTNSLGNFSTLLKRTTVPSNFQGDQIFNVTL